MEKETAWAIVIGVLILVFGFIGYAVAKTALLILMGILFFLIVMILAVFNGIWFHIGPKD